MTSQEGRRRWTDPRDGRSYSVHCRPPGRWLYGRHRDRPGDPSEHWQILFYPDGGGPEWLDRARP
jgi:hypothetical protein